jgi:iron complex outermembrane recepter protein
MQLGARFGTVLLASMLLISSALAASESLSALLPQAIPAQPLNTALLEFARTTGVQVVYTENIADQRGSAGAPSGLPLREALTRLLEGTGLQFEVVNDRLVKVVRSPAHRGPRPLDHPSYAADEVVITANRLDEEIQHVPNSIVTWTREELDAVEAKSFADVAIRTPGVEYDYYPDLGPGTHTNVAIRGIDSRDGTATAVFLDDVPLRPDPAGSVGRAFPLLTDLDRVEILRGPQSTLLGEGAEGGAIRFITTAPNLDTATGYARLQASTTERGAPSMRADAALGAPLVDAHLGVRLSAGYQAEGGFVDRVDPFTLAAVDHDVNRSTAQSARLAATWAPSDALQITPAYTYQMQHTHDSAVFFTALSDPPEGVL